MNILIVDNDALTIQVLQKYVGDRLKHQTVGVRTGAEALALLECQDFDLVMMALELPDVDGFEVLGKIRHLIKIMDLPVLVMGENNLNHQLKAFDAGANDYVFKPLEMRLVLARVHTLLRCRNDYLFFKRGRPAPVSNAVINIDPSDRTTTLSTLTAETKAPRSGQGSRPIPCEVPVMVFLEEASFFCKTLKIGKTQMSVLAFNEIPRAQNYRIQIVHPTGDTMDVTVVENRRSEVAQGAAGYLNMFFDVVESSVLFDKFCDHLDRAWRVNGISGLKEVLKGSMSISRAEGNVPNKPAGKLTAIPGARYRHKKLLGVGGFATVFLVRDLALQRDVAMKVLSPELAADASAREKFLGEARIAAQFHHANIVFVYEVNACNTTELRQFLDFPPEMVKPYREHFIYFTMQYIEGRSLSELIKEQKRLPVPLTVRVFGEVLRALAFAHQKGVIHRDIKPGNIMIDADDHIIVTDFGIARLMEDGLEPGSGGVECTPRYASPEQLLSRPLDGRSDIYSLGITIYEMLSGAPPFQDMRLDILVARQLNEEPPDLCEHLPELSRQLSSAVMRCIAKDPKSRYANVDDILSDLSLLEQQADVTSAAGADTLTLLLDRALLVQDQLETKEIMEKLVAHLHLHKDDPEEQLARIRERVAEPAVLDTLLMYGLDESLFSLHFRFFDELRSSKAIRPLLRWCVKEKDPRVRRFLSRLAVLTSGEKMTTLVKAALELDDENASLVLRAIREMGRKEDQSMVIRMAQHQGEQTRLELLQYIRSIPNPNDELSKVVRNFARTSIHPKIREFAAKLINVRAKA